MKARAHRRRPKTLLPAALASGLVHAVLYWPVEAWLEQHFAAQRPRRTEPVEVVRLSPEAWSQAMERARQAADAAPTAPGAERSSSDSNPTPPKARPPKKKPKEPEPPPERGQVVDVPATRDDSPNPDAKYLGKFNSNVEKESVARIEARDPRKKRRTHELQEKRPAARKNAPKAPGMQVRAPTTGGGTGGTSEAEDAKQGRDDSGEGGKKRFALEIPDLRRKDPLNLKLSDLPDFGQSPPNRTGSEEVRGNSDRFELELGDPDGTGSSDREGSGGSAGAPGLPSLDDLRPSLGTVGRVTGSPSSDYVEKVPEGDGTFLNTKQFKYATFFIRVHDSVESHWNGLFRQEYRRRDPTGRLYGRRNRSTLLSIVLDRDGRLGSVKVAESCGLDFLDRAAVEAFRRAQPFPNPPDGIVEDDGTIRFTFQFVVVFRPNSPFGGPGY